MDATIAKSLQHLTGSVIGAVYTFLNILRPLVFLVLLVLLYSGCMLAGGCHHSQERAACNWISHWSCVRLLSHAEAGGGHQPIRGGYHGVLLGLHVRPAGGTPLSLWILPGPVHQRCGHAGTGMG